MQKVSSLIALLLIAAILLHPPENTPAYGNAMVSPQVVCGDTAVQKNIQSQEDKENEREKTMIAVVVVIIIIIIIGTMADKESG